MLCLFSPVQLYESHSIYTIPSVCTLAVAGNATHTKQVICISAVDLAQLLEISISDVDCRLEVEVSDIMVGWKRDREPSLEAIAQALKLKRSRCKPTLNPQELRKCRKMRRPGKPRRVMIWCGLPNKVKLLMVMSCVLVEVSSSSTSLHNTNSIVNKISHLCTIKMDATQGVIFSSVQMSQGNWSLLTLNRLILSP